MSFYKKKKTKYQCYAYYLPKENRSGTVATWAECEDKIRGKDAMFKGFVNQQDAYVWLKNPTYKTDNHAANSNTIKYVYNKNAPLKSNNSNPNDIPDELIEVPAGFIEVWTDGACSNNQSKAKALGGVGVYFGPNDPRNVSEPLTGGKHTNQRAELTAILRAMEKCPNDNMYIYSDSKYGIKGATEWLKNWKRAGWKKQNGEAVLNVDLWEKIDEQMRNRKVLFRWVKGHSADVGNIEADKLAVQGAERAARVSDHTISVPKVDFQSDHRVPSKSTVTISTTREPLTTITPTMIPDENMFGDSSE